MEEPTKITIGANDNHGVAQQFIDHFIDSFVASPLDPSELIIYNCRVHMTRHGASVVHINDMQSMIAGAGSRALDELCKEADRLGVTLTLLAKGFSSNPTPTKKLVEWYSRFGFVTGMGNQRDGWRMERQPVARIQLRGFNRRPH